MRRYFAPLWKRLVYLRSKQAILLLAVSAGIFLAISVSIHRPGVGKLDVGFTRTLQQYDHPVLFATMEFFTFIGNTLTLVILAALAAGWLFFLKRYLAAWLAMASLLGLPLNMLLKEIVGRPRPDANLVSVLAKTIGLSFPSGHAMGSMMFFGFLAVLAWMHLPKRFYRIPIAVILVVIAALVSVSRIYLGAHWLSDVVGAWTAGSFFLLILVEIYKHWGKRELTPVTVPPTETVPAKTVYRS